MVKKQIFTVAIRKDYFPKDLWPDPVELTIYVYTWPVLASSREEAARILWSNMSDVLLGQMLPNRIKVSLDVNEPNTLSGKLGRLEPICVYDNTTETLRSENCSK